MVGWLGPTKEKVPYKGAPRAARDWVKMSFAPSFPWWFVPLSEVRRWNNRIERKGKQRSESIKILGLCPCNTIEEMLVGALPEESSEKT